MIQRRTVLALPALLLAGCASGPRNVEQDNAIRRLAIVSILEEDLPVVRIGLTVFNNTAATLAPGFSVNQVAEKVVAERVSKSRPTWTIVQTPYDSKTLATQLRSSSGRPGGYDASRLQSDLASIANTSSADALLVIVPEQYERVPFPGIGIRVRTLSLSSISDVEVVTAVTIRMLDAKAMPVAAAGTMHDTQSTVPASSLGLGYDLTTLDSESTKLAFRPVLLAQIQRGIFACMAGLQL